MKIRFYCAAPLLIFGLGNGSASAANWQYLTTSSGKMDVYVDVDSLKELPAVPYRRPFPVRQLWVKFDHSEDPNVKHRTTMLLERYDCSAETSMVGASNRINPNGESAGSYTNPDSASNYSQVFPETIANAVMNFACGRRSLPGTK